MGNKQTYDRYQRQMILKGFGEPAQQKLQNARVLVIGAGGLGCPALQYLVAAGIGHIAMVDDDVVSVSNLHRQVLYNTEDVGKAKAVVAKAKLQALNPAVEIVAHNERLVNANCLSLIGNYEVILDGTDNFATRYMINDACVLLGKPLVYGAVSQYEGQVAVFNALQQDGTRSVNYRDLFPIPPNENEVLNCAQAGVLGVLPGIIGTMQASEVIKLITGVGKPLTNTLLTYNAWNNETMKMNLQKNEQSARFIPASQEAFLATDYLWLCGVDSSIAEISPDEFDAMKNAQEVLVIDVRELNETPVVNEFPHEKLPLSALQQKKEWIKSETIILFCQTGVRSKKAAKELRDYFNDSVKIFSLKGGILAWQKNKITLENE